MKRNVVWLNYDTYLEKELEITKKLENIGSFKLVKNCTDQNIKRKQGFLLILYLYDFYYKYNLGNLIDDNNIFDIYEFDRLYRKKLGKFDYTIIIDAEVDDNYLPFSNTYFLTNDLEISKRLDLLIQKISKEQENKKEIKFTKKRLENIEKLKTCINKIRKDYFKMEDLEKKLHVNKKWLQRYLKDMNYLYNNIGFDRRKKLWYIVRKNNY